jgi:hypothetical protein
LAFLSDEQASLIPFCQVARKVVRKNISLSVNGSSEIVPIRNQNGRGRQTTAKQLSRFHGVTRYCGKLGVRWRASAVGSHIGSYADEEEAARATDEALRKFHGADAHGKKFRVWQCKLNFPTELETEAFQKQLRNDATKKNLAESRLRNAWGEDRWGGRDGASAFCGVSWAKKQNKWTARIRTGGSNAPYRHIGAFDDEEVAARAWDKAARKLRGDKARLNFPGPGEKSVAPSSRFRGVQKHFDRWSATIQHNGISKNIGSFTDEITAARTYEFVALRMKGSNAKLNIPQDALQCTASEFPLEGCQARRRIVLNFSIANRLIALKAIPQKKRGFVVRSVTRSLVNATA